MTAPITITLSAEGFASLVRPCLSCAVVAEWHAKKLRELAEAQAALGPAIAERDKALKEAADARADLVKFTGPEMWNEIQRLKRQCDEHLVERGKALTREWQREVERDGARADLERVVAAVNDQLRLLAKAGERAP